MPTVTLEYVTTEEGLLFLLTAIQRDRLKLYARQSRERAGMFGMTDEEEGPIPEDALPFYLQSLAYRGQIEDDNLLRNLYPVAQLVAETEAPSLEGQMIARAKARRAVEGGNAANRANGQEADLSL